MINEIIKNAKVGDTVEITSTKVRNIEHTFRIDAKLDNGFVYGISECCDGYFIPFNWITEIRIVR